jgi:hypothetical protein
VYQKLLEVELDRLSAHLGQVRTGELWEQIRQLEREVGNSAAPR